MDGTPLGVGPIVYRLGRYPFKVERRVRFPYGLLEGSKLGDAVTSAVAVRSAVGREWQQAGWRECPMPDTRRPSFRGRSSVWLEHSTVTREVAGSSPVGPVTIAGSWS